MGLNLSAGMDVCLSVFLCVFMFSCLERTLAMDRSPIQGVLAKVYKQDSETLPHWSSATQKEMLN
jgi:hypothetical protein